MSSDVAWYRDRAVLRFVALHYVPWMAAVNLAWEAAHVRLYTLWVEASVAYIAFSVLHCTVGDVLIGVFALLFALLLSGRLSITSWRFSRIALLVTLFGTAYTVWSEWMNVRLLRSWAYADSMPRLAIGTFDLGLTPVLQWLIIPSVALLAARSTYRR
jgi:hypothetical protein